MPPTESELEAKAIVEKWISQPPWMLAELRRRMKLRGRARELHRLIREGKL